MFLLCEQFSSRDLSHEGVLFGFFQVSKCYAVRECTPPGNVAALIVWNLVVKYDKQIKRQLYLPCMQLSVLLSQFRCVLVFLLCA
jgi:hypothetical protein